MLKMQRHISCIVVSEESKFVNVWEIVSVCEIRKGRRSSDINNQSTLTGRLVIVSRCLLNHRCRRDCDSVQRTIVARFAGLNVDGVHAVVAVLGVKLDLLPVRARGHPSGGHATGCHGGVASVAVVAVGREETREDATDDWTKEW